MAYLPSLRMDDPAFRPDPAVAENAWLAACRAGRLLRESGWVSKVWIWGSLLITHEFHPGSDIDAHVSWRPGAKRDELWERCLDAVEPFGMEFSVRLSGKRPLSHPIVQYRTPDQAFTPKWMPVNRRLRLLQDRIDHRMIRLRYTLDAWPREKALLASHGLGDLVPSLAGFIHHTLREGVLHGARKLLWTVDRRPVWAMSDAEWLEAASAEVPGLRPAYLPAGVAAICLSAAPTPEESDLTEAYRAMIDAGERFSRFLGRFIDPVGLRDR